MDLANFFRVVHPEDPQLPNLVLQLLQVGGLGFPELHLHQGPCILKRVDVRAVARPFDELDTHTR